MAIRTLFPTSVYESALTGVPKTARLNRELLREAHILRDLDTEGRDWSTSNYVGGYTSYASLTDLHKTSPTFADLARQIDKHVRTYAKRLEMDLQDGRLVMSTCWVNIMPTGSHHSGHIHPLSVISGTYYVSVPRGSSEIKFEDPRLPLMMNAPPKRADVSARNRSVVRFLPKVGRVILFESWLRHEVPANRAKEERVSVSFNYEWQF